MLPNLSILNYCHTLQVEFVMAYPQDPINFDPYMELMHSVDTKEGSNKTHVLKLIKNLYVQKQAGRVWNHYLFSGLTNLRFVASAVDEYVFYQGNIILLNYVDDGVFLSTDSGEVDMEINKLKSLGYNIEYKGYLNDYLSVNAKKLKGGTIKLMQLHHMKDIIRDTNLNHHVTTRQIPAASINILHRQKNNPPPMTMTASATALSSSN